MNIDSNKEKHESSLKSFRFITGFMAIGVFIFIAIICILLALLLICGWKLVYMI